MGGGASANPATAKILTSTNPLDDLVSIFGNANMGPSGGTSAITSPVSAGSAGGLGGLGGLDGFGTAPTVQAQPRKPQDDLLDLF